MGIKTFFKSLFRRYEPVLRDGMLEFLDDAFNQGMEIARALRAEHPELNGFEFTKALFPRLKYRFPQTFDTWLGILGNLLLDAMKKAGKF